MTALAIGFLPLTDSAVLVAAHEMGFAAAEGLSLTLVRDISWATVRDRLVYRQVQAAHLLAPLAVGVSLGLGGYRAALAAPFKLNLNGNLIVVSHAIADAMGMQATARVADPAAAGRALRGVFVERAAVPVLGVVHRLSSQALMLRDWLHAAGIEPDRDVALRVLPPSFMAEALAAGEIDGFCAGEPWGSIAVANGHAQTAAIGARIWPGAVEKVLALRRDWMESNPDVVDRLLRALDAAAAWCEVRTHHAELARVLGRAEYLDQPEALILPALEGRVGDVVEDDVLVFHRGGVGLPQRREAVWIHEQLVRWGLADAPAEEAAEVFRPDVYRRALPEG